MAKLLPKRGVEVLMDWQQQTKLKKEWKYREEGRRQLEMIEREREKAGKYVNKGSLKYIQSKECMH